MNQYQLDDIYVATITSQSTAVWGISPPSRMQLHNELKNRTDLYFYFDIAITRFVRAVAAVSMYIWRLRFAAFLCTRRAFATGD